MMWLIAGFTWIIIVTAASAYIAATWQPGTTSTGPSQSPEDLQRKKTAPVNVPMIANGKIEGYIVAQFVYLASASALQKLAVPPDDLITDEVFRELYSKEVDFKRLERYDLQRLTKTLIEKINQRLGPSAIKDLLVAEFTYIPKQEISK